MLDINLLLICTELGTLEWWISGLMLNPLFFLNKTVVTSSAPNFLIQNNVRISKEREKEWIKD